MRSITRFGLVACAVAVTLVLAGCRGGDPAGTAPGELGAGGTAFELLTQSGSYHRQQHTLTVAEERLVGSCMAARGLAYPAEAPVAVVASDEERSLRLEQRHREGYGLFQSFAADPADGQRSPSPVDRYVQRLSSEEQAAYMLELFGDERRRKGIRLARSGDVTFPGQGCVFESQSRIFGDIMTWARITYVTEDLNNKLTEWVVATSAYTEAMRGWGGCMAQRGHPYPSPGDAKDDLSARYTAEGTSDRLRRHEIAVAVADAECAAQGGIPRLVLSLKESHVGALSAEERRSLVELANAWSHAVTVAEGIAG